MNGEIFLHFRVASLSFEGLILQYANDNDVKGGFIRYTNFETVAQKCFQERQLGIWLFPTLTMINVNVMKPFLSDSFKVRISNETFFDVIFINIL